jgi:predicted permease
MARINRWYDDEERGTEASFSALTDHLGAAAGRLRRSPHYAAAVILSLGLGLGANAAAFAFLNTVFLHHLAFMRPSELVTVETRSPADTTGWLSAHNANHWAGASRSLWAFTYFAPTSATVKLGPEPAFLQGAVASASFLSVLGVQPAAGRWFHEDEEATDPHIVVISDSLRRAYFPRADAALGASLTFNGMPMTIVGVLPPDVLLPGNPLVWLPSIRRMYSLNVVARRRPGVSVDAAQRELNAETKTWTNTGLNGAATSYHVVALQDRLFGDAIGVVHLLFGVSAFILVLALVNVASLTATRSFERRRSLAIRSALGATTGRLLAELLAEAACLTIAGVLCAAALASISAWVLGLVAPEQVQLAANGIGIRELLLLGSIGVISAPLVSVVPAFALRHVDLSLVIGDGSLAAGNSRGYHLIRHTFTAIQFAVALALLAGTGMVMKSLATAATLKLGFEPHHLSIVTLQLDLKYAAPDTRRALNDSLVARFRALPDVERVAAGTPPLMGDAGYEVLHWWDSTTATAVARRVADTAYLSTTKATLRVGRWFAASDTGSQTTVVVLNRAAADLIFPNGVLLGRPLPGHARDGTGPTVIGVLENVEERSSPFSPRPAIYYASGQMRPSLSLTFNVRSKSTMLTLDELRAVSASLDADLATPVLTTADQLLARPLAIRRFAQRVFESLAGLALLIACLGIYAVVSDGVMRRTPEFAIRRALGQQGYRLVADVVSSSLLIVGLGTVLGLVATLAVRGVLSPFVDAPSMHSPLTLAAATALLFATALLATIAPVRRALSIEPMRALRGT